MQLDSIDRDWLQASFTQVDKTPEEKQQFLLEAEEAMRTKELTLYALKRIQRLLAEQEPRAA